MPILLTRHGRLLTGLFDLLGQDENSMTEALGFTLSRCPAFLRRFLAELGHEESSLLGDVRLRLQEHQESSGITDLEIEIGSDFFAILEAKKGPLLPSCEQLARYAPRLVKSKASQKELLAVTNATPAFARVCLEERKLASLHVKHISWAQVRKVATVSRREEQSRARWILQEFTQYLEGVTEMDRRFDNRVYVVALSDGRDDGWKLTYRQLVEERNRYYYPVGGGWPDPPNYLGFRYGSRLQHIRHVRGFRETNNFREVFPEAPDAVLDRTHYFLELGPPIVPSKPIPNGEGIARAMRVWCMIDALLVGPTIRDAMIETKRRENSEDRG